jgi:hypothetical protein
MATDIQTGPDTSMTGLVNGIITDVQDLFKQQVALLRVEIRDDLAKAKEAGVSLAIGGGLAGIGGILLGAMLALVLSWATGWAAWVGFGIVGTVLMIAGLALCWAGMKRLETVKTVPVQSVEAVKENVQWATNQK